MIDILKFEKKREKNSLDLTSLLKHEKKGRLHWHNVIRRDEGTFASYLLKENGIAKRI